MTVLPGGRGTTASLFLCALTHAYLLFSVFPYAGYMSVFLLNPRLPTVTVDTVGLYAGLLGTVFTAGRAAGFNPWRAARDSMGLKGALQLSLSLSAACSVWFGLSRTYASALLARFFLGLSNGISGAVKRAAIERARSKGGEDEEEWATATILAVMNWGMSFGPLLGGLLSDPAKEKWAAPNLLRRSPFLLPNVVGAALCVASMVSVALFVEEAKAAPASPAEDGSAREELRETKSPPGETTALLPRDKASNGSRTTHQNKVRGSLTAIWKSRLTRSHLLAYWSFSFVVVCVDEALPLYLISRAGGPGLSESSVGYVLSGAGFLVAASQYATFDRLFEDVGLYPTLRLSSVLGNVPSALLPLALLLNGGTYAATTALPSSSSSSSSSSAPAALSGAPGLGLTWPALLYLIVLVGAFRAFATLFFATIGVATGRTVPATHRDEASRLMTLGALAVRAVAPAVSGGIVARCMSAAAAGGRYGSVTVWSVVGLAFGAIAAALAFVPREGAGAGWAARRPGGSAAKAAEDGSAEERRRLYLSGRQRAQIYVKLWDVHYDRGSNTVGAKWRRAARKTIALNRFAGGSLTGSLTAIGEEGTTEEQPGKMKKCSSWADRMLQPGVDVDDIPFFILGTHQHDETCHPHVLTPPLMDALHNQLPIAYRHCNFWLKYSLVRDGASIEAIEELTSLSKVTVMAIETLDGDVFGCFMTVPWVKKNSYVRCGQSFLWRMKKRRSTVPPTSETFDEQAQSESDIEVYRWTGENDLCQLLAHDKIAVGGGLVGGGDGAGFGFVIEGSLFRGSSSPCVTYGNPCLVPDAEGGQFEVANVEMWAMTPFLFVADAERSEQSLKFKEENLNATTGSSPSSASAWSNFL